MNVKKLEYRLLDENDLEGKIKLVTFFYLAVTLKQETNYKNVNIKLLLHFTLFYNSLIKVFFSN